MNKEEKKRIKNAKLRAEQAILDMRVEITQQELEQALLKTTKTEAEVAEVLRAEQEASFGGHANQAFLLDCAIDTDITREFTEQLLAWKRQGVSTVDVVLNSPGGYVSDGFAMVDTVMELRDAGIAVDMTVRGNACSMAAILLQAGTTRRMGESSVILLHQGSTWFDGTYGDLVDRMEFMRLFHDRALDLLTERSKLDRKEIKERWDRKDWYLTAKRAKKMGFVDAIG